MAERRWARGLGLDMAAVLVFVAIGRDTHARGRGLVGLVETAAPFLIGVTVAWVATAAWRRPLTPRTGLGVGVGTVLVGMLVRRFAFGDGTAAPFVLVATGFLVTTQVGWRLAAGPVVDRLGRRPGEV